MSQVIKVEPNNAYMDICELRGGVHPSACNATFKETDYDEIEQYKCDANEQVPMYESISKN